MMAKLRYLEFAWFVVFFQIIAISGCDEAKQAAVQAVTQTPAAKKSYYARQEWTLSDQSKLSAVLEVVEDDEFTSWTALVVTRTSQQAPLKLFEWSFIDEKTKQPYPKWERGIVDKDANSAETYRLYFSAPEGSQIAFRVQVGEQPEVLSPPWTLTLGDE